jgi:hypothetical protein
MRYGNADEATHALELEAVGRLEAPEQIGHVRLKYAWALRGSDPQPMNYPVRLTYTPCRYGNARPWWECPRCEVLK